MNKKVFFFDIDGTLLSEKTGQIPESAIKALQELQKKGHLTFINTGRSICSVPAELKCLPFTGMICGCGAYITDGDKVIYRKDIDHQKGRDYIALMERCDVATVLEGELDCYFPARRTRFDALERTRRYFYNMGLGREHFVEEDAYEYEKFVFYADEKSDLTTLVKELEQDMDIMDRGEGFYEVVPKTQTKATAIDFVLDYFHLNKDQAYVFGDSSNDLTMFQAVNHAIAMGVHSANLEPYTEYITDAVEQDGIWKALEHYGIL